jgi:hypothetical protein
MIFIVLAMIAILAVACLVVVYVAYPHRGEEMPSAPWVGEALRKTVDAVPTLPSEREVEPDHAEDENPR